MIVLKLKQLFVFAMIPDIYKIDIQQFDFFSRIRFLATNVIHKYMHLFSHEVALKRIEKLPHFHKPMFIIFLS